LAGGLFIADDHVSTEQNSLINKLCPPSCSYFPIQSLNEMETFDQQLNNPYL